MPNDIVLEIIDRLSKLEARVESCMSYQKWQIGLLTALILMAVKTWVSK